MLDGLAIFENHSFRKEALKRGLLVTNVYSGISRKVNDYGLKYCVKKVEPFLTLRSVFDN
jgi:hypothetical protein